MVARTFELITDCLVCMGSFFLWFGLFLFSPACSCFAGSCAKAVSPPQTRHGCAIFLSIAGAL
jgi:hypothetical protein